MKSRIYLEKFLSEEDFEYYFSLVNNEKVMAMVTERAIPLEEAKNDFTLLLDKNKDHKDFGNFKVFDIYSNRFIGLGKLEINKNDLREAELGYLLLPEFWGEGYGGEIAKVLLNMAEEKGVHRITAIIDPKNIPSKKILLNNGFVSEEICEIDGLPGEILGKTIVK